MDYYYNSSYNLEDDHQIYYTTNQFQPSMSYSDYGSNGQEYFSDYPLYSDNYSSINGYYSASCYSQSDYVVYDEPAQFQTTVFYSVSEVSDFNEVNFEEYDSTPYGGGYDIALTYGKALPPSDETCYPRSNSHASNNLDSTKEKALIPIVTPKSVTKPALVDKEEPKPESKPALIYKEEPKPETKPTLIDKEYEERGNEFENELRDEDYLYDKVLVPYVPSGYGLEAMDICETVFGGYFPCLSNKQIPKNDLGNNYFQEERNYDPWKSTADYIFGSSYPYGEKRSEICSYYEEWIEAS